MRTLFTNLHDVPAPILKAYRANEYHFSAPQGPSFNWSEIAWINHVTFSPALEGLRQVPADVQATIWQDPNGAGLRAELQHWDSPRDAREARLRHPLKCRAIFPLVSPAAEKAIRAVVGDMFPTSPGELAHVEIPAGILS